MTNRDGGSPGPDQGAARIAYVMTHYPRVALTFIAGEVDGVTSAGFGVVPIAMNAPSASDLPTEDASRRARDTLYLKDSPSRTLAALIKVLAANPFNLARLAATAITSARWDLALILRRLAHLAYAARVADKCRSAGVHHLHAHFGQAPATIAWFASEILSFSQAHSATWSFTIHGFQDFVDEAVARLDLKARAASFIVCVSDFTASQLCRVADPVDWPKIRVVRCGIDLDQFAVREWRHFASVPTLLAVGRLSPEKGHLLLLSAIARLAQRGIDVELDIVGSGPFEGKVSEAIENLGLSKRVRLLGELQGPEVRNKLLHTDIFCMPSFSEGLPVSIMEAMAVGVPVVTTWISGIPELAVDGETAVTVAPGNSEALADGIERLISRPDLIASMTQAARAAVERDHSLVENSASMANLFNDLIVKGADLDRTAPTAH